MTTETLERYFFFSLLFITIIFTFFIFKPFWIVLTLGVSFAIVLYPIQQWFIRLKFSNWSASFVTVIIFLILVCGPLLGLGVMVFNQSQDLYLDVVSGNKIAPLMDELNDSIAKILPGEISIDLSQKASDFVVIISNNIAKIFSTTLSTLFSFLLLILSIFYFLKDGSKWKKRIIALSPMRDKDDQRVITRLENTINGVLKGYLLIALVQGLLMGIGLAVFGVPNPALWGVVAAVASLIPYVGTALVSVPSIIFLYVTGNIPQAIGMLAWAIVLVGLIDNLLSPIVVGKKTNIPEFIILFAVLGGISLLGPVGILIGPLAVSLLYTLISIYRNEFKSGSTL